MKQFINNVPSKIVNTFAIMINAFFIISKLKGIENIPVIRLGQLAFLAVMGGILIEVAFGTCLFKRMSDVKRITLFMVLFALITFGCAVWFQWITHLESIRTYISFIGIFFIDNNLRFSPTR